MPPSAVLSGWLRCCSCGADIERANTAVNAGLGVRPSGGWRALHFAAAEGREEMAAFLLDSGATVDPVDKWGRTPLMIVCEWGQTSMVTLLLDRGADLHARGRWQRTPFMLAARAGSLPVISLLLERGADIHAADARGDGAHAGRRELAG